ncbi:hypothetical protein EON77_19160, partial [bacterium]
MNDTLESLRDQLGEVDSRLLDALAERMKLAERVAVAKAAGARAPFDRERENAHLAALEDGARSRGLSVNVLRDVYAVLFAASRVVQSARKVDRLDKFRVGVIGATAGMGQFL